MEQGFEPLMEAGSVRRFRSSARPVTASSAEELQEAGWRFKQRGYIRVAKRSCVVSEGGAGS